MRFIFADSITKLRSYTDKGWLYFFLTRLQPNTRQAFVKFGLTEQALIERLDDYTSLNLANIYAIRIPCEEVFIREGAMKQIFRICKENNDVNIWKDYGVEYLKGDLDLMLRVFLYFCTSSLDEARSYKFKKSIIDNENLLSWINSLPTIDKYNINRLSSWKKHKMSPEVNNILDVVEDTIDTKLEITPVVKSNPVVPIIHNKECVCDKCGKECKDKRGLTLHVKKCEGVRIHQCEYCGDEFANQYTHAVHLRRCKIIKDQNKQKEENTKQEIIKNLSCQENENEYLKAQLEEIELKYTKELYDLRNSLDIQIKHKDNVIQSCKNDIELLSQENDKLKIDINNTRIELRTVKEINTYIISQLTINSSLNPCDPVKGKKKGENSIRSELFVEERRE